MPHLQVLLKIHTHIAYLRFLRIYFCKPISNPLTVNLKFLMQLNPLIYELKFYRLNIYGSGGLNRLD